MEIEKRPFAPFEWIPYSLGNIYVEVFNNYQSHPTKKAS